MGAIESVPRRLSATSDGSIALPPELIAELGWHEGDSLALEQSPDGELALRSGPPSPHQDDLSPAERVERFRQSAGKFFQGVDPVAYQRALRDEWEEPRAIRERERPPL
ncbi:hypothetical protein J0H33_13975 [bacterium]|nr:hypothetical protein [bacterium]